MAYGKRDLDWYKEVYAQFSGSNLKATADAIMWDPLESTCRHASLSIL